MTHYDFIVIGSGAGGGTLANQLVLRGHSVLLLERGGFLPREKENWDAKAVFRSGRYISADTWYDRHDRAFQPQSHYFVGGATKLYGAALFRMRPRDFTRYQMTDGTSPAWPVGYDDLEPWYTRAEQMYQVHGNHGEDPTEGRWSKQYRFPALAHEPRIQELSDNLAAAGYRPFHAPAGVLLQEGGNCIRCSTCDGHPCRVSAKADAETIAVRPLFDYDNFTLVTDAEVKELLVSKGRVIGVMTVQGDRVVSYSADTVILAAGAANTAKILLSSDRIGIANSSGMVGRNFMMHNSRAVMMIGREPNPTVFQKTLALHDFYGTLGSVQMVGKSTAAAMRGERPLLTSLVPGWSLEKIARHSVDFWLTTEDVPLPGNRVTLAPDGNIRLDYTRPGDTEADGLYREVRTIMNHAGAAAHHLLDRNAYAGMSIPLAGVAHQAGTARMGDDPATSVVDANMKAHDLDNLYIADASVFASIGAVNPALTVMALALRLGDHLS